MGASTGIILGLTILTFVIESIDSQAIIFPSESVSSKVCCIKDQIVTECSSDCLARTCANVKLSGQICSAVCTKTNVCQCGPGLYLNECNVCVTRDQCYLSCTKSEPRKCNLHETLYSCFDPLAAKVCPSIAYSTPRDVFLQFAKRSFCVLNVCDCSDGYLRNKCGQCVLPSECGADCVRTTCEGPNTELETVYSYRKCRKDCGYNKCRRNRCRNKCKGGDRCHRKCQKSCDKCKKCRVAKHECVCKVGYARNNCGVCVPLSASQTIVPCACTNPCDLSAGFEWQCFNECNRPNCQNYIESASKTCPTACNYGCFCSAKKDLWYNGTACVPGLMCAPRYPLAIAYGNIY